MDGWAGKVQDEAKKLWEGRQDSGWVVLNWCLLSQTTRAYTCKSLTNISKGILQISFCRYRPKL